MASRKGYMSWRPSCQRADSQWARERRRARADGSGEIRQGPINVKARNRILGFDAPRLALYHKQELCRLITPARRDRGAESASAFLRLSDGVVTSARNAPGAVPGDDAAAA